MFKKIIFISLLCFAQLGLAEDLKIHFATEATYPPFEYIDQSGNIKGFDIDIANAICDKINATCTFSNAPFDSLIPSLQMGKYDALIGALGITPQRQKVVAFSDPYFHDSVSFVAPVSEKLELSKDAMKGKVIGVQGGTVLSQYLTDTYGDDVTVKTYASELQALMDLQNERVDAVLGDTPLIKNWLKKQSNGKFTIVDNPVNSDSPYFSQGFGIAVNKKNKDLLAKINKGLAEIKADGTYEKISNKYFGEN